jgi:hypothetical protein
VTGRNGGRPCAASLDSPDKALEALSSILAAGRQALLVGNLDVAQQALVAAEENVRTVRGVLALAQDALRSGAKQLAAAVGRSSVP